MLSNLIRTEPVRLIGIAASVVLAVVTTLLGEGVISDALAGQITDGVEAAKELLVILAPIFATELARRQSTPFKAPRVLEGTTVEVITPDGEPNRAIVAQ